VSDGLPISVCSTCGHAVFPYRLLCPRCGGAEWRNEEVGSGVVEEVTTLRRAPGGPVAAPVPLGSVRLDGGVVVIARLEGALKPDDPVRLEYRDGVPVARQAPR
jgi:uncharacterized protein